MATGQEKVTHPLPDIAGVDLDLQAPGAGRHSHGVAGSIVRRSISRCSIVFSLA